MNGPAAKEAFDKAAALVKAGDYEAVRPMVRGMMHHEDRKETS